MKPQQLMSRQAILILSEMKATKAGQDEYKSKFDALQHEIDELKKKMTMRKELLNPSIDLYELIRNQESFLESLDAHEQQCKAVITGSFEAPDAVGADDMSKLKSYAID